MKKQANIYPIARYSDGSPNNPTTKTPYQEVCSTVFCTNEEHWPLENDFYKQEN